MPSVKTKDGDALIKNEDEGRIFSILKSLEMAGKRTDDLVVGENETPAQDWINNKNNSRKSKKISD